MRQVAEKMTEFLCHDDKNARFHEGEVWPDPKISAVKVIKYY